MSGFVIEHLMLRCIVTALLVISIAGYVYALVAQHGRSAYTVKHALHLAMSAAMIAMAWSVEMSVPTVAPIIFFLLAAVWFVLVPARISCGSGRLIDGYHAAEMTAMAWMYAVMDGGLESQTHAPPGSPGIQMAGMAVPGPEMSGRWIGTVNWAVAAGFAVATLCWLYRYFTERGTAPVSRNAQLARIGMFCHATTAGGAAIMFAVLM